MLVKISTIGGRIRATRQAAGLSQADLARRLGMTQGTISRTERDGDVRMQTIVEIARALDLDVVVIPRRLHATVVALLENGARTERTAIYTGRGEEPYDEGDADDRRA